MIDIAMADSASEANLAMSFDEAAAKFRGCAEFAAWPMHKTESLITYVKTLDSARELSALSPLLSAEKG